MSEEEPNLSACMQKLKIMPRLKPAKTYRDEDLPIKQNPFARKFKTKPQPTVTFGPTCSCKRKRNPQRTLFKRPTNQSRKSKLLREPVIVFVDQCFHIPKSKTFRCKFSDVSCVSSTQTTNDRLFGADNLCQQDFKSIITGCEQLSLAGDSETPSFPTQNFRDSRNCQPKTDKSNANVSNSCSQQAMARLCLNPPCDVTIDELASYFETFVHIPKKMSSMAEMMYI